MSVILPDICLKWRRLPFSQRNVGRTLPDEWCCAMHPDSNCNRFVRIFILFTFFSPLLLVRLLFLLFRWNESWHSRHDLGESSSGCDVLFTVMISKKKERVNYLKCMKNRLKQLNSMEDRTWFMIKFLNAQKLARLRLPFTRDPWNRASVWSDGKVCMFLSWLEVGSV